MIAMRTLNLALSFIILWLNVSAAQVMTDMAYDTDPGERMAHECLRGNQPRRLECLAQKGFDCRSVGPAIARAHVCAIDIEGGCFRQRFQLSDNGWGGSGRWDEGACADTPETPRAPNVRLLYDNVNAPDYVRYRMVLADIFSEAIHEQNTRGAWRYIEPGAGDNADYAELTHYFVTEYWEAEKQLHEESRARLCDNKQPRYRDERLNGVYDAHDDLMLKIYEERLAAARETFADDDSINLNRLVYGYPAAFSMSISKNSTPVDDLYAHAKTLCADQQFRMNYATDRNFE